jgi:peptidoglycan/xylan/chitin deacetylase (PgdA/CDA1 family)
MIISNARGRLAGLVNHLGLLHVVSWLPRSPRLVVVNYHRIGSTDQNPYDDAVFSATADAFRAQVRFLQRHFDVPPPDEVVAAVSDGFRLTRPTALLTFDDGYRDNYELAFPVLKACGASAIFFIPTDFVDHPRLPWWDRIAFAVKQSAVDVLELDHPRRATFDLRAAPRRRVVKQVLDFYKAHAAADEAAFLAHLEQRTGVSPPDNVSAHNWIVTWNELREMAAGGMCIGSHTHTHGILGEKDEPSQLRELQVSKEVLERELGRPVTTLAYPVGSVAAFSEATKRLAHEAGYRLAFSYYGGTNGAGHFDPFDVRRVTVEANESMSQFRTRAILNSAFGTSFRNYWRGDTCPRGERRGLAAAPHEARADESCGRPFRRTRSSSVRLGTFP